MFSKFGRISLVLGLLLLASWGSAAEKKPAEKSEAKSPATDPAARTVTIPGEIMKVLDKTKTPRIVVRVHYWIDTGTRISLLHYRDVTYRFDGDPVVRTKDVPKKEPKPDGTPQFYTPEQLREMKGDPKLPGYPKELSDLRPGMAVELSVVKDPDAAGTRPEDFLIRHVLIVRKPEK
jgi:hypothetical protein